MQKYKNNGISISLGVGCLSKYFFSVMVRNVQNIGLLWGKHPYFWWQTSELSLKEVRCFEFPKALMYLYLFSFDIPCIIWSFLDNMGGLFCFWYIDWRGKGTLLRMSGNALYRSVLLLSVGCGWGRVELRMDFLAACGSQQFLYLRQWCFFGAFYAAEGP